LKSVFARCLETPIGQVLTVTDSHDRLKVLVMNDSKTVASLEKSYHKLGFHWQWDDGSADHVKTQLEAYFQGGLRDFDLEVEPEGTPFQRKVWAELRRIPHGEVISYGTLARRIGQPTAARGVGAANGANPIFIVVPCHRVVGSNGSLTGFACGLDVKAKLLCLEGHRIRDGAKPKMRDFPVPENPGLFDE